MPQTATALSALPRVNLPWTDSPFFTQALAASALDAPTRALVEAFARDGYVVIDLDLPGFEATADAIIGDLAGRYAGERRLQDAWQVNDQVKALACEPRVLELLRTLFQREPIPFQTLNFPVGTQQKTHSDTIHFHSVPERFMCGVWVALEDIDADNGPLHYYPGSHKLPVLDYHTMGLSGVTPAASAENYRRYEDFVAAMLEALGLERREVAMRKGQALIWAANLYHGGSPIRDARRSRHSQVTHYYFTDCMYYTPMYSDPFLGRVYTREITDIRTGERVPQAYNGQAIEAETGPRGFLAAQKHRLKRAAARLGLIP